MGYTFTCDICDEDHRHAPPLMGEFSETFLKTSALGGYLADEGYRPGTVVTICATCIEAHIA